MSAGDDVAAQQPLVELRDITKLYGAVAALKNVDFRVSEGEVVGLVGDNGAGKSTLMKILAGALEPTSGEIFVGGTKTHFAGTRSAIAQGIHMVFQDLALCPDLDVAANFFIAHEPTRFGLIRVRAMHSLARERLERLGISLHSTSLPIRLLSGGQRQCVAIARALAMQPRLLILDEPTAALGVSQSKLVLDLIRQARTNGTSVVPISHRLRDVLEVCSRIVVLYEGSTVADLPPDVELDQIVRFIVADPRAADSRVAAP
ncbi:MAG TPA: ATP-binding cassette domain-containing protein [Solirubrobacteraceae bacterium]